MTLLRSSSVIQEQKEEAEAEASPAANGEEKPADAPATTSSEEDNKEDPEAAKKGKDRPPLSLCPVSSVFRYPCVNFELLFSR